MSDRKLHAAVLAGLMVLAGCSEAAEQDDVGGDVALIDRTTSNLLLSEIDSINGSYGVGCLLRNAGDWSLGVAASPSLTNPLLTVVKNNAACVLKLTSVKLSDGNTYTASSPITLGASFASPVSFGSSPIQFWGNAKLSVADFSSNVTLTLLYSDDPRLTTDSHQATFSESSAQDSAQSVPAPNYTLSTAGLSIETDFNDVVQSVTGNLALTINGSDDATNYVITSATVGATYEDIRAAYEAGTPVTFSTSIAGSGLSLVGTDLTSSATRTLILAKVSNGVRSYQKFTITFNPPSHS